MIWNGIKTEVVLDDHLWINKYTNNLVSITTHGNELWAPLLEKCWAKCNKSYDNIDGGMARDPLHDFTGAPVIHYRLDKASE
jgi:hypothetical protein